MMVKKVPPEKAHGDQGLAVRSAMQGLAWLRFSLIPEPEKPFACFSASAGNAFGRIESSRATRVHCMSCALVFDKAGRQFRRINSVGGVAVRARHAGRAAAAGIVSLPLHISQAQRHPKRRGKGWGRGTPRSSFIATVEISASAGSSPGRQLLSALSLHPESVGDAGGSR